ncbi:aerobic glycerol-3-phosphate dehydrogenase [mine drainage metagenome]|uniref:Aerobic glycerol-3-phosphate dehydrogenase n=1 Tax=mine drainage metagenome TaxID=410659 RepID=A0A1J5Q1R4_9ZZZZ
MHERHPWLPYALAQRYASAYGSRIDRVLIGPEGRPATCPADLGREILPGLFEAELRHLQREEWARTAEDVLWRRSKLGLSLPEAHFQAVKAWFTAQAH